MRSLRGGHGPEQLKNTSFSEAPVDLFTCTSGRWLHRDQTQRKARFLEFEFPLLCQKAIDASPGARSVLRYEKKEGGFSRVFVLHMDNGTCVVARIPFRIAGPRRLMTHSEVATMAYVESRTNITIPKILDWSSDERNPVGTEYIIMQWASGVQLHEVWPTMTSHQHMLVTKALAQAITELANLEFSTYGSLYFDRPAAVQKHQDDQLNGFVVGPHCGREFWDCVAMEKGRHYEGLVNRGPWATLEDYAAARAMDETLLRLCRYCRSSWRDGAKLLRQELIELSQRWSELGLPGSCPYQPSAEELAKHAREWQDFETAQKFKVFLMRALDATSEGWVPNESWEAAKEAHRAAFKHWMETVRESDDPEMTEARGQRLWPWDER